MSEHTYRTEGSDTKPYRMLGMCSCGWRGQVRDIENWRTTHDEAMVEWQEHVLETERLEAQDD